MCNVYDDTLFFRIVNEIVPHALKKAKSIDFFVKGGRAIDAFIEIPTGSPDWDICVPDATAQKTLFALIRDEIITKTRINNEKISKENFNLKGQKVHRLLIDISETCREKEIIDIVLVDKNYSKESANYEIIEGVPYKNRRLLFEDLEETLRDREAHLIETQEGFESLKKRYSERFKKAFETYKDNETKMFGELSKASFPEEERRTVSENLKKIVNINNVLIEKYNSEGEYTKLNNMVQETIDEYEAEKFEKKYSKYLENVETILSKFTKDKENFDEEEKNIIKFETKYIKTLERRDLLKEVI